MKFQMAKNSIFAKLLRSPWYASAGVAAGVLVVAYWLLPGEFLIGGAVAAIPFAGIAVYVGYKALRAPSPKRVAATLEKAAAMSWREFADAVGDGFRNDGYDVKRLDGKVIDFEVQRAGRVSLLACKRWKAATTGVEPLRDLESAMDARETGEGVYVTVGSLTDNARRFAGERGLRVLEGADLARVLWAAERPK